MKIYNWIEKKPAKLKDFFVPNQNKIIYCLGDSHVSFFSGYDNIIKSWPEVSNLKYEFFKPFRLGPILAYNLNKFNSKSKGREKLLHILHFEIPTRAKVLLCFGEIDCRAHLLKQAIKQKKSIEMIIANCVNHYFKVIMELRKWGFEVLIWNVIPSGRQEIFQDLKFPFFGTLKERNSISKKFNIILKKKKSLYNIPFIDIFNQLIEDNGETKPEYLYDGIHLSQAAMPFVFEELEKKIKNLKIRN